MVSRRLTGVVLGVALLFAAPAFAEVIGFVNNPEGNSLDWRDKIAELGGEVNEDVDFETHPVGPIVPDHYADIGVGIAGTGSISIVRDDAGPGQANVTTPPLSNGEGVHPPSHYVYADRQPGTFTISFNPQILGAGMFLVDLFNPNGVHPVKLDAFTGPEGTGDLLGSWTAAGFNFQKNKMYFMGVVSTEGDIGSVRVTVTGGGGDELGMDDVLFAPGGSFCQYRLKRDSKAKGGCEVCPVEGDIICSGADCEKKRDCEKKLKGTIACPDGGPGICKRIKGKRSACD